MEAEAVRDNVLAAAGTLDATMGGPDLDPALGETLRAGASISATPRKSA